MLSFFIILLLSSHSVQSVSADEVSLGISPPNTEISLTSPASKQIPLTIENFSNETVTLTISYQEFTQDDNENGGIIYRRAPTTAFTTFTSYLTVLENNQPVTEISLNQAQKKTLLLDINLPTDMPKRDYTFSIIFTGKTTKNLDTLQNNSYSTIQPAIAANILLSVNQIGSQEGTIDTFSAPKFMSSGPIPFTLKVSNMGQHKVTATGTIAITNMFGQQIHEITLPQTRILSQTKRWLTNRNYTENSDQFEAISNQAESLPHAILWDQRFLFGYYKALATLSFDETTTVSQEITFVILPYKQLVIFVATIAAVLFIQKRLKSHLSS